MEKTLEVICAENGLNCISVQHHLNAHTTVFIHWQGKCNTGSGNTFDAALAAALHEREVEAARSKAKEV